MADIVNSMSILPQAPQVNMQTYTNAFDTNRATYAENKMLYEKARIQMAKDEQSVAPIKDYQDSVVNAWNQTFGSINESIEAGDFIGLDGIIDKAALDYATDWNLNTAKYNTIKHQEFRKQALTNEKDKHSWQTELLLRTQQLPNKDPKTGKLERVGEYNYGADYFDMTTAQAKLFSAAKEDFKDASRTDIENMKFVTVSDISNYDGEMAYNFGLITGSTAKYDATNKVMYIQYDEHSYGTMGNGLAKVSEINNAKAQAIYSIISHDHDAIAYFKSMADLLTADGTPTKASDLMIEASRTKDWETIFKSNLYYSNVKEQLQNAPTSQLDIEDVPTSTIKDDSIFTTTVVEGGHGYDDSGSSNSRKVDKNLRLGISNTLRDTNAKLYDAELLYTQYQDEVLLAQEEYTNNPTPETRNKLETAKRNFDSSSKILQTLTEQREHNLNFLRSAISTVRAENGLTPSNEILTYDEFKTALEKDSNATIYDINKYTDSESTTSKFYAHPKRYKELNSDLPEYIAQETFRLINEEGVSTSKGLLQGIGQSLGIKMQSSDDENAMIQAITYRVFKGAGFSDEDALKYSKPSIKDGLSNRSGVYHFLKQFDNVQKAANNIFDYFKDVEFTIPYDVVMESEDKNAPENAMNNYVSSIIQGATLYDQYGEVVSPDGSSHARFINKIKNMENVTGSATMTILNGMYGIQIRGETALESTSMKNPMVERESTIAFLDNKSSIQLLTKNINNVKLANSKNKELEGSLLPSGLTMTQEKQFAEDEAMLSKSYDGIYLSTISSVLDRAGDKFLASTGGKSETFDHTFDIGENPKVSYNMPGTIKFEYINNTGENEYAQFDYLKRSGKIAMQVTYPTEINGTYRNVNRYVYALGADVTFEQLNNITMSNIPQLQDLEKEGYTNYDIVPTPSGILVLLYESTYSGNVLEDFDNGVDAMVATHYLAKGMETSK